MVGVDGGISSGLVFVFYYKGLEGLNAVIARLVTPLGPVTGVTLSVLLLDEQFSPLQVATIAGLLATMYFLSNADLGPRPRTGPTGTGENRDNAIV